MTARTAAELADALVAFAADQIEALAAHHAPGLVLPRVFAGHAVGPDARADLAFTLGLLAEAGRSGLAGVQVEDVILATLRGLDGPATHTFYSYRAAESLLRLGGYHGNPRLRAWSAAELANLRQAVDSSAEAERLGGQLPTNFNAVIARCEHARDRLGLLEDDALLTRLCERTRQIFEATQKGWIDDSNERRGQYDIYTADMFLFAEPLADRLGDAWTNGLARVLRDVDALALPGGAIVWGRSIGALSLALEIELAAIGVGRGLVPAAPGWLARAGLALDELASWYSEGVIRAHQHRAPMFYRGPARRLQMTLDVLGKLVQAALELRRRPSEPVGDAASAWAAVDRVVTLGTTPRGDEASAWAHRDPGLAFVLPLVSGWSVEYLPAPRAPGLFECPTGGAPCFLPVAYSGRKRLVTPHLPVSVEHAPHRLTVGHAGFFEVGAAPGAEPPVTGRRLATYTVEGRTLRVEEELHFEAEAHWLDGLALLVPERADRPLDVAFETEHPHTVDRIDVEGLAEWQGFHGSAVRVHQIDLAPAASVRFRWSVRPLLRVASTAHRHPYDRSLYRPLGERVVTSGLGVDETEDSQRLHAIDVLHVHWPEWWAGLDPERTRVILDRLRASDVRILWTQHNLLPHHAKTRDAADCYAMWAQAAAGVIHHTEWGRARALATHGYGASALHRVIPHGHWGWRVERFGSQDRARVERELGLSPCGLRLGVVGAPRVEKDVQLVLDAFHACSREDLQLLVTCVADERVPDDPRILALPHRNEDERVYFERLAAVDVFVFPFEREGMLMTGTAFDAIGSGKAALISSWPALVEVFGDAAISYGETREDLTACLESLDARRVEASALAIARLREVTAWPVIAESTLQLLEEMADL